MLISKNSDSDDIKIIFIIFFSWFGPLKAGLYVVCVCAGLGREGLCLPVMDCRLFFKKAQLF